MPDYTEYQRRLLFGYYGFLDGVYYVSGDYRPVLVDASGRLVISSGVQVIISGQPVDVSGSHVWISGQHVFVESGVHVVADVAVEVSSGLWIDGVSGVHVYQESGAFITTQPNIGISGTVTVESGLHVWVSGQHLYQESGAFVTTQPNIGISGTVTVESGLHVWVSGQHVYQESGAFVTTQPNIGISGTVTVESGLHIWVSGQHIYQESGAFMTTELIGGGSLMDVDGTVNAGVMISAPHHEVHEGTMWHAWCIKSGLADNANLDMLVVTGSGKEVHMAPDGACGGDAWVEMYEGVATSDDGTLITPNCMHRTISGTAKTLTYCEPTVTSTYHPLTKQFMTGGEKKEAVGGIIRPNTEWVFDGVSGSIKYLIRIKNVAGDAKDASVGIEFYEEDHNPS